MTDASVYLDDPNTWTSGSIPVAVKNTEAEFRPTVMAYIQDFISITNQFKVLAGVRWSYVENKINQTKNFVTNSDPRPKGTATNDNAFSPKFGLVISKRKSIRICNIYQFVRSQYRL
jgi:iron complex outermembrane receptor protein